MLLSNGRYTILLDDAGTGRSTWGGVALTAWTGDAVTGADGAFVYLREGDAVWTVTDRPIARPTRAAVTAAPGSVAFARRDRGIEARLDVCVAPDADLELRRLRLANRTRRPRTIEVTTYVEVVLGDAAAHAAHPAFSKLFVETERAGEVLLAHRRARSAGEATPWMAHALAGPGTLEGETDRARFLGRGRTPARPRALAIAGPLSGTVGNVLDPVLALRRTVRLAPGASAEVVAVFGAAATREAALALAARADDATATFTAAREAEATVRRTLGLSDAEATEAAALATRILGGDPRLRPDPATLRRAAAAAPAGRPYVFALVDRAGTARLLRTHAYWRARGVDLDLVLVGGRGTAPSDAAGVHVVRRDALARADLDRLRAGACAVLDDRTARATVRARRPRPPTRSFRPVAAHGRTGPPTADASLRFANGHGGFTADGRAYLVHVAGDRRPPMPWINVLANERVGCLVTEAGAGYTWSRNSREHRLTPWSNDPIADPYGEALWIRDEDRRVFWSPLPGPVDSGVPVEATHGFGSSGFRQTSRGLAQEVTIFVPRADPVKLVRLRVTNTTRRRRRLSVFAYFHLVLGVLPAETAPFVETAGGAAGIVHARSLRPGDFPGGAVFAAAVAPAGTRRVGTTGDRRSFLGPRSGLDEPAAVAGAGALDGRFGLGLDPCAALEVPVVLARGATAEVTFLLGETTDRREARALVRRYRRPGAVARALEDVRDFWTHLTDGVRIETPSPALDVMVNGWLPYQTLACRLWARSAFYQSGGAFGFRDQLQDAASLVWLRPDVTRAQLLRHAAHQFVEGDVLHWWHPPAGRGTRTRFSDDLAWLPYVAAAYVRATGDAAVLEESVPFVVARPLAPGEDEAYLLPARADEAADLYAHCCRALDRALTRGAHGLPLMGTGDWNDGMNRVGRLGRGESVWLGFFLHHVLDAFLPLVARRGDAARAARYEAYRAALATALETAGWDGAWYRRAYYDDGTPLGTASADECRIDGLVQAWAVISGVASRERAERAMDAVLRLLVDEEAGLVRLLTPPFDRTPRDPGYIKGYVPGIRENGGQYTHAALWVVRALAELGRRDRAARLLEMLTPVHHARTAAAVGVYQVEPYVVAADVYAVPPHVGRGGWTWYTGSSGWMYRVALESVLGLALEDGATLRVAPRIPDAWPGFRVHLRLADGVTRWLVDVANPRACAEAVVAVDADGVPGTIVDGAARVPLDADGRAHVLRATLGPRVSP